MTEARMKQLMIWGNPPTNENPAPLNPDEVQWMQEPRHYAEGDGLWGEYKGYQIRLNIPNGGILSASIIKVNSNELALSFASDHLDKHLDEAWHVSHCKHKIDRLYGLDG